MKILMLNTFDEVGGAARAATRLLAGVRQLGIDAALLVQFKTGNVPEVICNSNSVKKFARRLKLYLGLLPTRVYPNRPENNFSPALLPDSMAAEVKSIGPDIIHLHWLGAGFLRVETLPKLKKPLIWTLHDSWGFTGGCHVPFDCTKYRQNCGACPVLGSPRENDLSRRTWERKDKAWRNLNLTVVTPSRWLADCARSSALFRDVRVKVIPNGLDTEAFQPKDKGYCRNLLDLPGDKKIILFGAMHGAVDPNKGFHLLSGALKILGQGDPDVMALVFGSDDAAEMTKFGLPVSSLGRIDDDQVLTAAYSAADVFVAPSLLENLPNTVMEAMACGTPGVAFHQGGMADLIEHRHSGYLAQPYDIQDLARGIAWVLEDRERLAALSTRARQKVEEEFALELTSRRYADLYREVFEESTELRHD